MARYRRSWNALGSCTLRASSFTALSQLLPGDGSERSLIIEKSAGSLLDRVDSLILLPMLDFHII